MLDPIDPMVRIIDSKVSPFDLQKQDLKGLLKNEIWGQHTLHHY
jgi:hypothetical protein